MAGYTPETTPTITPSDTPRAIHFASTAAGRGESVLTKEVSPIPTPTPTTAPTPDSVTLSIRI